MRRKRGKLKYFRFGRFCSY